MRATQSKAPPLPSPAVDLPPSTHSAVEGLDRFLSHVSHELRTPLSAITLWVKLLEELGGRDPNQLREAVGAIQRSAGELERMIEDLIDMSRVLTGRLRLEPRPTAVASILENAIAAVRPFADEHRIEIEVHQAAPDAVIHGDPGRLTQIVRNLTRHAVEVSPVGSRVVVAVRPKGRQVEITVTDSGPGLPPQLESHVFDHFGLGSVPDGHPASGVTLAVVRRLVEVHDGRIRAHSGPEPGTTYTLRLPAGTPDEREAAAGMEDGEDEIPVGVRPLRGRHVLVVEDSSETRRALGMILSEAGAQVTSVDSSSAALVAFKRGGIDLVVSDLGLPKMDGYEMMQQFRRWERLDAKPSVPAVALTAYAGEGTRRRAFESGYQGCLTKPVDPPRLVGVLTGLLRPRRPAV